MKRVIKAWIHTGNVSDPFFIDANGGVDTLATTSKDVISNGSAIRVKITVETCERKKRK